MYLPPQQFTPVYASPIHHQYHHTPVNPQQHSVSPQPFISLPVTQHSQADFPQLDTGLTVPTFQQVEDLIECINQVMTFLSAVASRFPPLNNQLRTSSNLINQATIQVGRVTVQHVQGRQSQSFAGTGNKGITTTSKGNYAASKKAKEYCMFKLKLMLAEAQEACQILDGEKLPFLAHPGISKDPVAQQTIPQYLTFQNEDLDAYDSDYDDESLAKAVLMANLSSCVSDVLFEESQDAIMQDTNSSAPNDLLVLSLVEQMTDHVAHLDKENQTNKMVNESLTAELERYKERVAIFKQRQNVDLNKREKLIDSQMDDLIWNRNAKLKEIDTLKETLSNHTCPSLTKPSEKLIVVTPMNKEKNVRFAEPVTSLSNIPKQTDSIKTKDSNKSLLTSTGVKPITSASGSKLSGNIKNNKITRPPSSNQKNKVEDHSRKVKSSLNKMNFVSKSISNAHVKHSVRNAKFESICAICNKCLFDANHEMCVIDYVNDVNMRSKSKSKRNKMRKEWKPMGKVSSQTGYSWKPIGTVQFGNDHIAKIMGYGDYQMGNVTSSQALKTKSWLWHYRLSRLNFDYITSLAKHGLVRGFPKLKYQKDHLCSACALGKRKEHSYKPKAEDSILEKLYLLLWIFAGQ
nr:integrase, catalytic region, zinc finger, CCHC-type, peptidase aspartic, catalytic [Tanacetum cinerariifolium]